MVDFVAKEAVMEQPKQDMRSIKSAAKEQLGHVRGVKGRMVRLAGSVIFRVSF